MNFPLRPGLESRRFSDFENELLKRARAWIPSWSTTEGEPDFGMALLEIAARFGAEVAERLDGVGEKMARGFLDWLALEGGAARPARMPVAFKLAETAREPVDAPHPIKMQVDVQDATVTFETETDIRVVPGLLDMIVGVDPAKDAFFLPPPGLTSLEPREPLPTQWRLKNFAAPDTAILQFDPGLGLVEGMFVEIEGAQYRILEPKDDLATIDPKVPAGDGFASGALVTKVEAFQPFDGAARNQQEHVLYLGHTDLLNIEAEATIDVVGVSVLGTGATWEYWGKDAKAAAADPRWRPLTPKPSDPKKPDALTLAKPRGAVEPTKVGSAESRWIRARNAHLDNNSPLLETDAITLRVNALPPTAQHPPALDDPAKFPELPPVEAVVNTTPSPTSNFYPLGREPRLFDTLYLGSAEAFSKTDARAWVQFDLADPSFSIFSVVREGPFANFVIAGVAHDGALHLFQYLPATGLVRFRDRGPLQPPLPDLDNKAAESAAKVSLDQQPPWRLPIWIGPDELLVATTAGGDVWIWHEIEADQSKSGWRAFGQLPPTTAQPPNPADGLVYLGSGTPKLAALRDGVLSLRDWPAGAQWQSVDTLDGQNVVALKSIVPVLVDDGSGVLVTSTTAGMIGVSDADELFQISVNGVCTQLMTGRNFTPTIRPAAVMSGHDLIAMAVDTSDPPRLVAMRTGAAQPLLASLDTDEMVVGALEVVLYGSQLHFLASVISPAGDYLATWAPFDPNAPADPFEFPLPANIGRIGGAPAALPGHVVIPGARADIAVAEFDLSRRLARQANVYPGIVLPVAAPSLQVYDIVTRQVANNPEPRTVSDVGLSKDGEVFYPIDSEFPGNASGPLLVYRKASGNALAGDATTITDFTLALNDQETALDSWLLINTSFHQVTAFTDQVSNPRTVTIAPALTSAGNKSYWRPLPTGGGTAPYMVLDLTNGDWDAELIRRVPILFPDEDPAKQRAKAFSTDSQNRPIVVVLAAEFNQPPAVPADFIIDAAAGGWARFLGDTSTNPELAWEYWNGKGWWKLDIALDETLHLKRSGLVRFTVPSDIASTDWAGKTNYWIRARLIGGDYGREEVTVITKPGVVAGTTEQTIQRTTEGVQPPYALNVLVAYAIDQEVTPTFLLTKDSGTLRDQSDANRTPGAQIEVFTPLIYALMRLETPGKETAKNGDAEDCVPDCECPDGTASTSPAKKSTAPLAGAAAKNASNIDCECAPAATAAGAGMASLAARRALYLGFTSKLSGEPVNVLLVVEKERGHDKLAPLKIDALIGDRFVPVVATDETRALGETGLLRMSFSVEPIQAELFGRNLSWLRLTPGDADVEWKPTLGGAYLNAVWARAAETMTRELVGSSEGEPRLTLGLARPPLLHHSLELRVKESLGEEELLALLAANPDKVKSDVTDLPGSWVLWEQVPDPEDCQAADRVYSLDEESGTIRFGDGRHGAIPPVGVDTIVAFKYERTEPGANGAVPANFVAPRTALNLVTPVDSVEAVFAADQSAGGLAPEPDERVLQFGAARLRHRGRAVSARDFEDLALERFADVVQARCFARGGRVRLIVVMRGKDPQPSRAQIRELRRMLLAAAPAALGAPGAMSIEGPKVRRLRIELKLRVETLDVAGEVAKDVKAKLLAHFDTEFGGELHEGWPLGVSPREDDIAEALLDVQDLESMASIALIEIDEAGGEHPWPEKVGQRELTMLATDGIRVGFEIVEAVE